MHEVFEREDVKYIKGVAVILMLYHHLYGFPNRLPGNISGFFMFPELSNFMANFGNICVSIFLFLAGYAAFLKLINNNEPYKYVKRTVLSLYKVYLIVFLIFTPLTIYLGKAEFNLLDFVLGLLGLRFSYNGESWFFLMYVVCTLSAPIIIKRIDKAFSGLKKNTNLLLVVIGLLLLTAITGGLYTRIYNQIGDSLLCEIINIFARFESYMLGVIFAKGDYVNKILQLKHFNEKRYFWVVISFAMAVILGMIRMESRRRFVIYNIDPWLGVIVIVFLLSIQRYIPILKRLLVSIGNESTIMWLTHTYICSRIAVEWTYMFKFDVIVLAVLVLETYFISMIFKKVFKPLLG